MSEFSITTYIDDVIYTPEQLRRYEYERTIHNLHEMLDLGAEVKDEGRTLTHEDINWLGFDKAHAINVQTRVNMTDDEIDALYKKRSDNTQKHWAEWNAVPIEEQGYQICVCEFEVAGMGIPSMGKGAKGQPSSTMMTAARAKKYEVYPEHLITGRSMEGKGKGSMEVVGMYGEPSLLMAGKVFRGVPDYVPYEADPSYPVASTVELVFEDGTPTNMGVTHMFRPAADGNGFRQRSVLYTPANAPRMMMTGHQIHFAIEMTNDYTLAYQALQAAKGADAQ